MNQWNIGNVKITRIVETEGPWPGTFCSPTRPGDRIKKEAAARTGSDFTDEKGKLRMSIHALVIESKGKRIIVDTCIGNDKVRYNPAGASSSCRSSAICRRPAIRPSQIDNVVCTHLHVDHVGWNTKLVDGKWVPTFDNAQVHHRRHRMGLLVEIRRRRSCRDPVEDSVRPVVDHGQGASWSNRIIASPMRYGWSRPRPHSRGIIACGFRRRGRTRSSPAT